MSISGRSLLDRWIVMLNLLSDHLFARLMRYRRQSTIGHGKVWSARQHKYLQVGRKVVIELACSSKSKARHFGFDACRYPLSSCVSCLLLSTILPFFSPPSRHPIHTSSTQASNISKPHPKSLASRSDYRPTGRIFLQFTDPETSNLPSIL